MSGDKTRKKESGDVSGLDRTAWASLVRTWFSGHVYKGQIQLETRSSYRSLKAKHRIEQRDVPRIVMQRARQAAESYAEPLEDISRVKAATVKGRDYGGN